MDLREFLRRPISGSDPWNCATEPADWCRSLGYPDFAAEWRSVLDEAECERVVQAAGSLAVLWDRGIGDALRTVDDLDAGDIGVVAVGEREFGAIFTGERWCIRGGRARHFLSPSQVLVVAGWRP